MNFIFLFSCATYRQFNNISFIKHKRTQNVDCFIIYSFSRLHMLTFEFSTFFSSQFWIDIILNDLIQWMSKIWMQSQLVRITDTLLSSGFQVSRFWTQYVGNLDTWNPDNNKVSESGLVGISDTILLIIVDHRLGYSFWAKQWP